MKRGSSDLPERIGKRWQIDGYPESSMQKKEKARPSPRIVPLTCHHKLDIPADNQSYEISSYYSSSSIFRFKEKFLNVNPDTTDFHENVSFIPDTRVIITDESR